MNRKIMLAALTVVLGPLAFSCASTQVRKVERGAAEVLVSDEQEKQLGLQVQGELDKQGVKYLQDQQVVSYVQNMATPILQAANQQRKGVNWTVRVIDDPKTVNAFATPGGFLYVYSGLLMTAENESELAGVMAHEAGHVVARHSAQQMVKAFGLEAVASLALGQNPGLAKQLAASIVGNGAMLANSRQDETEADELGATFSSAAGYDPHGLVTFFGKLLQQQGKTPKVLSWLSDHPATQDRIEHVNQFIAAHNLHGTKVQTPEFEAAKARLH
ncbi:MAG: M48 family metallopeptidase [Myxococcaceae bacterium]